MHKNISEAQISSSTNYWDFAQISLSTNYWDIDDIEHQFSPTNYYLDFEVFDVSDGVLIRYRGRNKQQIVIPSCITKIGPNAFQERSLTSTVIPESVTSIGEYAFEGCEKLTSITIPNSVRSIGTAAFGACKSLESLDIPGLVKYDDIEDLFDIDVDIHGDCLDGPDPYKEGDRFRKQNLKWDREILPKAGSSIIRRALIIDMSESSAKQGNTYAKKIFSMLLLLQNRLSQNTNLSVSQLHHMPLEMWRHIAYFYYTEYFPKLDIVTTSAGLDELKPYYEKQEDAVNLYDKDMNKIKDNWNEFTCKKLFIYGLSNVR